MRAIFRDSVKAPSRSTRAVRCRRKSEIFGMTKELRSFEPRSSAFGLRCLGHRPSSKGRSASPTSSFRGGFAAARGSPLSVLPAQTVEPAESGGNERGRWLREDGRRKHRNAVRSAASPSTGASGPFQSHPIQPGQRSERVGLKGASRAAASPPRNEEVGDADLPFDDGR